MATPVPSELHLAVHERDASALAALLARFQPVLARIDSELAAHIGQRSPLWHVVAAANWREG